MCFHFLKSIYRNLLFGHLSSRIVIILGVVFELSHCYKCVTPPEVGGGGVGLEVNLRGDEVRVEGKY